MRPFRFSIAEMMVVVVIVAVNLSALRLLMNPFWAWQRQLFDSSSWELCPWPTCWQSGSCMGFISGRGTKTYLRPSCYSRSGGGRHSWHGSVASPCSLSRSITPRIDLQGRSSRQIRLFQGWDFWHFWSGYSCFRPWPSRRWWAAGCEPDTDPACHRAAGRLGSRARYINHDDCTLLE